MRKITAIILACLACLSAVGVSAYFVSTSAKDNVTDIGLVTTVIEEEFPDPDPVEPGDVKTKRVRIRNTGKIPCYVRAQILFSDSAMESLCDLDYDRTNWAYSESDGWWYYRPRLDTNARTNPLFTSVTVSQNADAEDIIPFEIYVRQESRQADGHSSYETAWE